MQDIAESIDLSVFWHIREITGKRSVSVVQILYISGHDRLFEWSRHFIPIIITTAGGILVTNCSGVTSLDAFAKLATLGSLLDDPETQLDESVFSLVAYGNDLRLLHALCFWASFHSS
jgi:hypothetical protein